MKIIGTHDELLLLKLKCQKRSNCEHCVMEDFCKLEEGHSPLSLFSMPKIKTYVITEGGIYEKKDEKS